MFNELINAYLQNFPQEELQALQGSPNFLRLNMLLNNDVEIRGTEWEGAYFPEITELYFQLMKLLSSQSPLFNHISEQKSICATLLKEIDKKEILSIYKKNKRVILQTGWEGHAMLMEMIDDGSNTQILIYNSGEGIENHGNPQSISNKKKYTPLYSFLILGFHLKHEDFKFLFDEFLRIHVFNRCYVGTSFYKQMKKFWLKDRHTEYKYYQSYEIQEIKLGPLGFYITPHRSGGCTIKVWFSAFQQFRYVLSNLEEIERKKYYIGDMNLPKEDNYPVARLKAKALVAILSIQSLPEEISIEEFENHHQIIKNLLDAIKKISTTNASDFADEMNILRSANSFIQGRCRPITPIELENQTVEKFKYPPLIKPTWSMDKEKSVYSFVDYLEEIDKISFLVLEGFNGFLLKLQNTENTFLINYLIRHFSIYWSGKKPEDIRHNNKGRILEWLENLYNIYFEILNKKSQNQDCSTFFEIAILSEKIFLTIYENFPIEARETPVDHFFNPINFHDISFKGCLIPEYLRKMALENKTKISKLSFKIHEKSPALDHQYFGINMQKIYEDYIGDHSDIEIIDSSRSSPEVEFIYYIIGKGIDSNWFENYCESKKIDFSLLRLIPRMRTLMVKMWNKDNSLIAYPSQYQPLAVTFYEIKEHSSYPLGLFRSEKAKTRKYQLLLSQNKGLELKSSFFEKYTKIFIDHHHRLLGGNKEISRYTDFDSMNTFRASTLQLNEFQIYILKMIKRGYHYPELHWSQGMAVLYELIPYLEKLDSDYMHMAYALIAMDYCDYSKSSVAIIESRRVFIKRFLEKSNLYFSCSGLTDNYFLFATILQIFLIKMKEKDSEWCSDLLLEYQENVQLAIDEKAIFPEVARAAVTYQMLNIVRRRVVLKEEPSFELDYEFFINEIKPDFLENGLFHPDLHQALRELQYYFIAQWRMKSKESSMIAFLRKRKYDPSLIENYSSRSLLVKNIDDSNPLKPFFVLAGDLTVPMDRDGFFYFEKPPYKFRGERESNRVTCFQLINEEWVVAGFYSEAFFNYPNYLSDSHFVFFNQTTTNLFCFSKKSMDLTYYTHCTSRCEVCRI